jgi:hypothetical protein
MLNDEPNAFHSALCIHHSSFDLSRYQFSGAFFQLHAAHLLDGFSPLKLLESSHGRFDQVFGAGAAVSLGQDIGDAGQLEARADTLAGGHACTGTRRDEHHGAGAAAAFHQVRDRGSLEAHAEHLLAGILGRFLDGGRHFVSFAITNAHVALSIAGHNQRAEAERSTAFDDLGAAVDSYDGRLDTTFIAPAIVTATSASTTTLTAAPATASTSTTVASAALLMLRLLRLWRLILRRLLGRIGAGLGRSSLLSGRF